MNFFSKYGKLFTILFTVCVLLYACGIEKHIPKDEHLYTGATLIIESDSTITNESFLKDELEKVITPQPNSKFLGMRLGLYYHYQAQKDRPGFLNKWLNKKIGEEPVYQSDVKPFEVKNLLINRLDNRGFFYSRADSKLNEEDNKAWINYRVKVATPYTLKSYHLDTLPKPIDDDILTSIKTSPFKKGMRFDLSNFELERSRIDQELKTRGYYNFNPQFLIFEADTNRYKNKGFDLFLKLKKDVPRHAIIPYKLAKVNIYSNYDLVKDTIISNSTRFNNKNFIENEFFFKTKHLDPFITLEENQFYNSEKSKNTARRLASIGTYKYVNIQYKDIDTLVNNDFGLLEANIYLSPLNKRSLRAELQAVSKSNNFAGPALALNYTNRNIFSGGETFSISAKVGFEKQIASGNSENLNSTEIGLKSELIVPRVLFPINFDTDYFKYSIPKTKMNIGIDYLDRSKLYALISGNTKFGYIWDANKFVTHEINPITINYTKLIKTSAEFEQILDDNPYLRESFDQEFIAGLSYSYTYNGMVNANDKHQVYLNTTFEMAGNTISLFGKEKELNKPKTILGLEYAQYAKIDVDFHYHFNLGNEQKIATRLFAGYGLAYSNSNVLPFVKQYYAGGPYSVRAFKIRSLGPGTFNEETDNDDTYIDQAGNIRLEANIEYRFPIISFLKGAIFVDAGNIWNSKENDILPGGKFSSTFYNELGMGAGIGTRIDVQGFVIRFDLAAPFHDPSLPKGERYDFRIDEPIFNFAIGYPF